MSFQQTVAQFPAPAVEGDFASANPRFTVVAGDISTGRLVAANNPLNGDLGLRIGRFAWVTLDGGGNPIGLVNSGQGVPDGFVGRHQQGLLTTYLQESGMLIPSGFGATAYSSGDFWMRSRSASTRKQKVFASLIDGGVSTAAAGSTIVDFTGTASFATNVMTVTVATSGAVLVGSVITSAGVAAGTYVTAQLTGTPGGVGTYSLSTAPGTITAQAVTTSDYVETTWYSQMAGGVNGLIKTSHLN